MTCREKGCYLSCKFLDLCLSKVHRSIQCCCMIICTVFKPSFWQRGLCREQWSCGGTGVGDTAQFWLTVSQYVEWGSMRCEITGPLLPLPQMIPGTPFLPSPVTERGGGGRSPVRPRLRPQGKCFSSAIDIQQQWLPVIHVSTWLFLLFTASG